MRVAGSKLVGAGTGGPAMTGATTRYCCKSSWMSEAMSRSEKVVVS